MRMPILYGKHVNPEISKVLLDLCKCTCKEHIYTVFAVKQIGINMGLCLTYCDTLFKEV